VVVVSGKGERLVAHGLNAATWQDLLEFYYAGLAWGGF
jgi:hypothetical protein